MLAEITRARKVAALLFEKRGEHTLRRPGLGSRAASSERALKLGWPAGITPATPPAPRTRSALDRDGVASASVTSTRRSTTSTAHGSGVVVLPCGAGKTLVGLGAMAAGKTTTLILVTNTVSARQWKAELLKRTTLTEDEIGKYSGQVKQVRPVTIATYQILTARRKGESPTSRCSTHSTGDS